MAQLRRLLNRKQAKLDVCWINVKADSTEGKRGRDLAFALASVDGDTKAAREALESASEIVSGESPHAEHRARAAIALAEGACGLAIVEARSACGVLKAFDEHITPNIQEEIDWNEAVIAEAMAGQGEPQVGTTGTT